MAFAPDGTLFFTEKNTGAVRVIEDGRLRPEPFATVPSTGDAESGLLGIALHPDYPAEPWVYLYYSSRETGTNLLVRTDGDRTETILEGLPVSPYHDGGDIAFGLDGMLYAVLGEAHDPGRAQDPDDLGGKIVRLTPEGEVPGDNPTPGSPVFSLGHRNSFGLCFDPFSGALWETENGPSEHDEVNLILPRGNYGWPEASGPSEDERFVDPMIDFAQIVVPTGCAFYPERHLGPRSLGALFIGTYTGTLYRAELSHQRAFAIRHAPFLEGLPGITDVQVGPDGRLYLATDESILRLPRRLRPAPEPGPTGASPSPIETVPPQPGGELPWLPWAAAGAAITVGAAAWGWARARRG